MLMLPSYLGVAVIVFALKINESKAACRWNGADSCLIYCINMPAADTIASIESLYAEREHCHPEFALRLQTLTYPNNTIGPFWFTANIRAVELDVYFNYVQSLSADAFNADAFQLVKKLTFRNFGVSSMVKGTFNGLDTLEIININGATKVGRIEAGVLDSITELQELTFEQTGKSTELNIDGFTGSSVLSKLEYVKIRYNLDTSIKKSTFIGLRNVKRLDLSSCYISTIEDNSFDPISETIEELDLSSNAFTTVSYGLFSMTLPNIKNIKFDGIKWDCVCDLMPFRVFVEQYKENVVGINCFSPTHCSTSNILQTDCFDTCDEPSTTTAATTTIPTTTTSPIANLKIQCLNSSASSNTVSIKRSIGHMNITENEDGETHLNIDTEQMANSLVVIRLNTTNSGETDNGSGINCVSRSDNSAIPITDLTMDVVYSYCLMRKTSTTVSPLDCISYVKQQDRMSRVCWLAESSKSLTIALAAVFLSLNIVVGVAVGFVFSKFCIEDSRNLKDTSYERNVIDKPLNIYTRNTMHSYNSDQNDTRNGPPLPERPSNLYKEEPLYACVGNE